MGRPHFDDESSAEGNGKKRKVDWKNQRHQKTRKHETKRDYNEHVDEEQDNRRDVRTRW